MNGLFSILAAYILGSIPFGYLLTRLATGRDVRASGSGNIGATNVLRTAGKKLGIATLLLDILKGTLAVFIAEKLTNGDVTWMALAALAVSAGHVFPVFLAFKGGKAVATFAGAFGYLMPLPLAATVVVFIFGVAMTKHISAGSILAAGLFPLGAWLILQPTLIEMLASIAACALVIYRHKSNIERLRAGTESVFKWGGK
ncbi:MAG: glycerol-3-phosphate 1-O-acyltransferase PlsY [Acidobacteriota bacterium]